MIIEIMENSKTEKMFKENQKKFTLRHKENEVNLYIANMITDNMEKYGLNRTKEYFKANILNDDQDIINDQLCITLNGTYEKPLETRQMIKKWNKTKSHDLKYTSKRLIL